MPKNCKIHCVIKGCDSSGMLYNDHFHKIKKRWLPKLGRTDLDDLTELQIYAKKHRVCSKHFTERAYTSTLRTGLLSHAEPELYLPDPAGPDSSGISKLVHIPSDMPEKYSSYSDVISKTETANRERYASSITKDEIAMLAVATVYSGSDGEGGVDEDAEDENSSSSTANGTAEIESFIPDGHMASKKQEECDQQTQDTAQHVLADDDSVCSQNKQTTNTSGKKHRRKKDPYNRKSTKDLPSYLKVRRLDPSGSENSGDSLHEELAKQEMRIRMLEKCLVEKSVQIQNLTLENVQLRRRNAELTENQATM